MQTVRLHKVPPPFKGPFMLNVGQIGAGSVIVLFDSKKIQSKHNQSILKSVNIHFINKVTIQNDKNLSKSTHDTFNKLK